MTDPMARKRGKRSNGEGSIYQRGDTGRWVAQVPVGFYANGNVKYKRYTCDTQREARDQLRRATNDLEQGVALDADVPTIAAYLSRWLETAVKPPKREPKTYENYAYAVSLITPVLGKLPIDKVRPDQVDALLHDLQTQGGQKGQGLSASTVRTVRATLRRALGRAFKQGTLARNAAALSEPVTDKREEVEPFTEAEANRLLDAATGMRLEALYNLAVVLGLRQGEILGLCWGDVDLPRTTLRVRQQLQQPNQGKPFLKPLKTRGSRRDLDLTVDLVRQLLAHRDRQRLEQHTGGEGWNVGNLVFPSDAGTPMYARNLITHYKKLLTRAGLPDRRFHNLRHTAATIMFARGMTESEVQRALGHSSIAITIDTYLHWIPTTPKRVAVVMDGFRNPAPAATG